MRYWLMKTEPESFSIDDLAAEPDATACWDGVRNYQARNMMRDEMRPGDRAFLYHSNAKPPGIVGTVRIASEPYPDHTAFDPEEPHFDPKSDPDAPRWFMVDVALERRFTRKIGLPELRENPALRGMQLLRKGNRLSVMPVSEDEWRSVLAMLGE